MTVRAFSIKRSVEGIFDLGRFGIPEKRWRIADVSSSCVTPGAAKRHVLDIAPAHHHCSRLVASS